MDSEPEVPNPLAPRGNIEEQTMADVIARLARLEAQQLQPSSGPSTSQADDVQPMDDVEDPQSSGGGGSVASALVRAHVARMNDAPSNFHQVTVEVCLRITS